MIYLDTHAALWLRASQPERFSAKARQVMQENRNHLLISPMVLVELQYLVETKRWLESAQGVLDALSKGARVSLCDLPFSEVAQESLSQSWTRDPFDRLIVSQARVAQAPLISKDRAIREHYAAAVW